MKPLDGAIYASAAVLVALLLAAVVAGAVTYRHSKQWRTSSNLTHEKWALDLNGILEAAQGLDERSRAQFAELLAQLLENIETLSEGQARAARRAIQVRAETDKAAVQSRQTQINEFLSAARIQFSTALTNDYTLDSYDLPLAELTDRERMERLERKI